MKGCITKTSWFVAAAGILFLTGFCRPALGQDFEPKRTATDWRIQAEIAVSQHDMEEAEEYLLKSLKIDPTNVKTLTRLAWVYNETRDFGKARTTAALALLVDEDHAPAWRELGYGRLRQKDCKAAVEALSRSVSLDPNDKAALEYLEEAMKALKSRGGK